MEIMKNIHGWNVSFIVTEAFTYPLTVLGTKQILRRMLEMSYLTETLVSLCRVFQVMMFDGIYPRAFCCHVRKEGSAYLSPTGAISS